MREGRGPSSRRGLRRRAGHARVVALVLGSMWLFAGSVEGQREVTESCLACGLDQADPLLRPGSAEARRALFAPLASPPAAPQEEAPGSCATVALVTGAVSAGAMVLLAVVLQSAFIWYEDDSATTYYLAAGGIAFGLGAGYGLVRCLIERSGT